MLTHRYESKGFVQSSVDKVFAHIDDHTRLSSHMGEPSWKMGGGRVETELDERSDRTSVCRVAFLVLSFRLRKL